jgi:hypothetical protein
MKQLSGIEKELISMRSSHIRRRLFLHSLASACLQTAEGDNRLSTWTQTIQSEGQNQKYLLVLMPSLSKMRRARMTPPLT